MARTPRSEVVDPDDSTFVLTISVAAAGRHLADCTPGLPAANDKRRRMLEECIFHQSKYFAIRPVAYSITSDSLLQMLQTDPEFAQTLTDAEVAYRWLMLCPTCRKFASKLNEPSPRDIQEMCSDPRKIAELRSRLCSISWWMRLINQRTAQWFNRIDEIDGVFWAGRFRAIRIVDDTALLTGLVYIDVSSVCSGTALSLNASEFTSIVRRFADESSASSTASSTNPAVASSTLSQTRHLAPIQKNSPSEKHAPESSRDESCTSGDRRSRCSDAGVLDITQSEYLSLVKSSCNALLGLEKMNLPAQVAAKLLQPDLTSESWLILIKSFGKAFSHIAGQIENMEACRTRITRRRFYVRPIARMLLAGCSKT